MILKTPKFCVFIAFLLGICPTMVAAQFEDLALGVPVEDEASRSEAIISPVNHLDFGSLLRDLLTTFDTEAIGGATRCVDLNNFNESLDACSALIESHPDSSWPIIARGRAYLALGNSQHGIADFERALRIEKMQPLERFFLAYQLNEVGRFGSAIDQLSKLINEKPANSQAYAERGYSRLKLGFDEAALSDFNRAIELDPANRNALESRGTLLSRRGDVDAATVDYVNSGFSGSDVAARATALFSAGLFAESANTYSKALLTNPDHSYSLIGRATAYFQLGVIESSLKDLNIALSIDPTIRRALVLRSQVLTILSWLEESRLEEAEADADRAIELAPTYARSYIARAEVEFVRQRYQDAIKLLDTAYVFDPTDLVLLSLRGSIHRRVGNHNEAVADLDRAIEVDSNSNITKFEWVLALAAMGETEAAKSEFRRLVSQHDGLLVLLQGEWARLGHYKADIDGVIGPATERALLACSNDAGCPAPIRILRRGLMDEASFLVLEESGAIYESYEHPSNRFSISHPTDWVAELTDRGAVIKSSDGIAQCGISLYDLGLSLANLEPDVASTELANQLHQMWLDNYVRNAGTTPTLIQESMHSFDDFTFVEYINDLSGGRSITWVAAVGRTGYWIDCETYTAFFDEKLATFRSILGSFQP